MPSDHSPVRSRKTQVAPNSLAPMQNSIVPRETSPSPSFRERQRAMKTHSMPLVPSVNQVLAGGSVQVISQPSPTGSTGSLPARRSPPATSRISPTAAKHPSTLMSSNTRGDHTPERIGSPPPLLHSQSTPAVSQVTNSAGQAQTSMLAAQPRPVPRVAAPQFLKQYQTKDDRWHVTEELLAEIERADQQQGQLQGTYGVAYAGGAASNSNGTSGVAYAGGVGTNSNLHLPHRDVSVKDPTVERVRATDRSSPKEVDSNSLKRQSQDKERDSPKTRERSQTTSSTTSSLNEQQPMAARTPEYRGSPPFHTPMSSPAERTAGYGQYISDAYQQQPQLATQTVPRKPVPALTPEAAPLRTTPPAAQKITSQTPPTQTQNTRANADRALPLQEEPEEDVGHEFSEHEADYDHRRHGSPTPSSDTYPEGNPSRYDDRRDHLSRRSHSDSDDDDMTLNEEVQEQLQQKSEGEESAGYTPRSPTTNLPERPREGQYLPTSAPYGSPHVPYSQSAIENQKTLRPKPRVASTDQMNIRSLDPKLFEQPADHGKANGIKGHGGPRTQSLPEQSFSEFYAKQPSMHPKEAPGGHVNAQPQPTYSSSPTGSSHYDDLQGLFDVPTSSYLQQFYPIPNSRPGAPVPPTPLTQTAAPSPAPLSAFPSDIEPRQVGSPYPYPFTHIRRTALSAAQNAPSSTFDHNNPDIVREQLALQMHMYALNNGLAPPSDSTFSPSSTPFPGIGYNPWIMSQFTRPGDSAMSIRSSPSHEPIPMPLMPPMRDRGLRRKDNTGNLRAPVARRRVKPPPRVESTQPRDTSPEPSSGSGEETAGEEQFVDAYVPQNGVNGQVAVNGQHAKRTNGHVHDDTEEDGEDDVWVDEEDEEEDLLQLEFHPTFINSMTKRRRRWETRWDALNQVFQTLDRETDATLLLLAAPSHSKKLHALASRSLRRDPNLLNSLAMSKIRGGFSQVAAQRRATRTRRVSLADCLSSTQSGSSVDGSQGSGDAREEELRRALGDALRSLNMLGNMYEDREARWREEMRRLSEDRQRVDLLLSQALGTTATDGHPAEHPHTP